MNSSPARRLVAGVVFTVAAMALQAAPSITSGPVLTLAPKAPLSCVLELQTSEPARVIVEVNDGVATWRRDFFRYAATHTLALHGFSPDRSHEITVSVENAAGVRSAAASPVVFAAPALPANFPPFQVITSKPSQMEPGFTLIPRLQVGGAFGVYPFAIDAQGQVRWYSTTAFSTDLRQLKNGNLFASVQEGTFLGDLLSTRTVTGAHHDSYPTTHGTILVLRRAVASVDNYPTSETDPNAPTATANVSYDLVREISRATGATLNEWSLLDILDPVRIGYLSLNLFPNGSRDWSHGNAVVHDPKDDSVVVSLRHQDAVVKFSRTTGELIWILGPHENWSDAFKPYLFQPVGTPFQWQYHQHAMRYTPAGTLLLFDNGNYRASPFATPTASADSYSRAVEYALDPVTMQISQVWEYGTSAAERLYTPTISDADWLPLRRNILVTFGNTQYVDGQLVPAAHARIIEVTRAQPAEKVFEMAVRDSSAFPTQTLVYRTERIFDFYAKGDLDMDGDVDKDDLNVVVRARNKLALSALDPRDLDRDGRITALDARLLTTLFYQGGSTE